MNIKYSNNQISKPTLYKLFYNDIFHKLLTVDLITIVTKFVTLFCKFTYRYRSEKTITKQMTENMQSLVSELCDVECKYVLASQLGFKKIIEDMLASSTIAAYLKDTVWKQGSSSSKEFTVETYRAWYICSSNVRNHVLIFLIIL